MNVIFLTIYITTIGSNVSRRTTFLNSNIGILRNEMLKYLNKKSNALRHVPVRLSHQIPIRYLHNDKTAANTQTSFQNEVRQRQAQAKQSIFIETTGGSNTNNELTAYCSRFGTIQNIFQMDNKVKSQYLVEFKNHSTATEVMRSAYHPGNPFIDGKIRPKGRFLTFNSVNNSTKKRAYTCKRETGITDQDSILTTMRTEKTNDNQIMKLFKVNRLSDLSSRLRFLTALQLEEAVSGVFYHPQVLPFGSSINGFGRMQSDLDMVLVSYGNRTRKSQLCSFEVGKADDLPRNAVRNNLFAISNIARHFLQGVTEVQQILNARVPIIKYTHSLTNLECDLSMGNISGYQMSEMLYTFGELDDRVRPIAFYIRTWAKEFDIIRTFPDQGLSNFMVTCLVIFFLQNRPKPILPPADDFISLWESPDHIRHITDTKKLNFKTEDTSTLSELLVEFFEYYSSFDFSKNAASIASGTIKANIGSESMYIYNPLEHVTNVSRNVSDFERNQFVEKCRIARDALKNDKIDAVELLEFYSKHLGREKINSFVNNMTKKQSQSKDNDRSNKFNVKTLMKY